MSFLDCLFSEVMLDITPPKTNMILENLNFQQEIHLQMVEFPASHVSFQGGYSIC